MLTEKSITVMREDLSELEVKLGISKEENEKILKNLSVK